MQRIRREVRRVRHQNADRNFDRAIVDTAFDPVHNPTRHQTHSDPRDNQIGQAKHCITRSGCFIF